MKKFIILLTGIIFILCFQGCNKESAQTPVSDTENLDETVSEKNSAEKTDEEVLLPEKNDEPIEDESRINYDRLWTIDIKQDGFTRSYAYHEITWGNEAVWFSFKICPTEYANDYLKQGEKIIKDGITFYFQDSQLFWDDGEAGEDGIYDSGSTYIRDIYFEKDELGYSLNANTTKKEAIDIVTPEILQFLAENPDEQISGFEKTNDIWRFEFINNHLSFFIIVTLPSFDSRVLDEYSNIKLKLNKTDDGLEYYSNANQKTEGFNIIIAKTDIGTIELRGGYNQQDDVKNDELDFINLDLVKYIYNYINQ